MEVEEEESCSYSRSVNWCPWNEVDHPHCFLISTFSSINMVAGKNDLPVSRQRENDYSVGCKIFLFYSNRVQMVVEG